MLPARRSNPKFGFRSKHYKVSEAVYAATPDQLDHALARWQSTAEGTVASTALDVSISSWRLLFYLSRCVTTSCHAFSAHGIVWNVSLLTLKQDSAVLILCAAQNESLQCMHVLSIFLMLGEHVLGTQNAQYTWPRMLRSCCTIASCPLLVSLSTCCRSCFNNSHPPVPDLSPKMHVSLAPFCCMHHAKVISALMRQCMLDNVTCILHEVNTWAV